MDEHTVGNYRIEHILGEGGFGTVWLAVRRDTEERVALKTLRVARGASLAGIRREIETLARVSARRHPGIVRIVDHGVAEGLPWYAMELCEGMTLRELMSSAKQAGTTPGEAGLASTVDLAAGAETVRDVEPHREGSAPPANLAPLLGIARRLCSALAFLHGEGVVHRDLKPENVIIRDDGSPVIVDFGLTLDVGGEDGRARLFVAGPAAGTPFYVAPEQALGETVDARADLYSLGCILHEIVTGRRPFEGDPVPVALRRLVTEDPPPPSTFAPWLPPEIDLMIARLLRRGPEERLGYASDVAAALARMGYGSESLECPSPRPYLYRHRFVGRDSAREAVRRHLVLARREGRIVLVSGESGAGKTRFLMEIVAEASAAGWQVLAGECEPVFREGGSGGEAPAIPLGPLRPWLQAIGDRCREAGEEEAALLVGPWARILSPYEPSLSGLPGIEALPAPVELPPLLARQRLFQALDSMLGELARRAPVVAVIDDLQWADDLTAGFVEHMASGRVATAPLLILGACREDEPTPVVRAVVASPHVTPLTLGRLDLVSVARMVGDMLAMPDAPERLVRFVADRSEGNPLFVAEYLRLAVAEGILSRDERGQWRLPSEADADDANLERLGLPRSLRTLIERRLAALPASARSMLQAAAVLGREIDASLMETISGEPRPAFDDAIQDLVARLLVELVPGDRVRFTHDKIRETAYEGIDGGRRTDLHRAAAEALRSRPDPHGEALATLGHHWERAGRPEEARCCYLGAARDASARFALVDAERLYRLAIALEKAPCQEGIHARLVLGQRILYPLGRTAEAIDVQQEALGRARTLGLRREEGVLESSLGHLYRALGRLDEARAHFELGLASLSESGRPLDIVGCVNGLALLDLDEGDAGSAQRRFEQSIEIQREAGDEAGLGATLHNLANVHLARGDLDRARELYEQALIRHRASHQRPFEGNTLSNLGITYAMRGRLVEAASAFEGGIAIHRETGNRRGETETLVNLGALHITRGDLEAAIALCQRELPRCRGMRDRMDEAVFLQFLGHARLHHGELLAAREDLEKSLVLSVDTGYAAGQALARTLLGLLLLEVGDLGTAWSHLEEALVVRRRSQERLGEAGVLVVMATVHAHGGRWDAGADALERALAMFRAVGNPVDEARSIVVRAGLLIDQARWSEARSSIEAALALAGGEARSEAHALLALTRLERLIGDLAAAESALARCGRFFAASGFRLEEVRCLCERGHLLLARGEDAAGTRDAVAARVADLGASPEGRLGEALAALDRAVVRDAESR